MQKKEAKYKYSKNLYFRNYLITSLRIYLTMKLRQIRKMFNYQISLVYWKFIELELNIMKI